VRYAAVAALWLATLAGAVVWLFSAYVVLVFGAGYYCEEYDGCGDPTPLAWVQLGIAIAGLVPLLVLAVWLAVAWEAL
jgi:hypothetical protein